MATYTDTKIDLILNHLTRGRYEDLLSSNMLSANELYLVDEDYLDAMSAQVVNVANPILSSDGANKNYVDSSISELSASIPTQVNADWNAVSGAAEILNKPNISVIQEELSSKLSLSGGSVDYLNIDGSLQVYGKFENERFPLPNVSVTPSTNVGTDYSVRIGDGAGVVGVTFADNGSGDIGMTFQSVMGGSRTLNPGNGGTIATIEDLSDYALLSSPNFIGVPTAPTAVSGTSTTQIATTEFVQSALSTIDVSDQLNTKLDSTTAAPDFQTSATYFINEYVTLNGALYRCLSAVTTSGDFDPTKWELVDMTTPDATLDITSTGKLRLVGADGSILWQEGYDLGVSSTTSLSNGAVNLYTFAENDMATVSLIIPIVPSGKVGDFVLDVVSPEIVTSATSYTSALFSDSLTYAVGDKVSYDSKFWECFLAVETAGAWTGGTNWLEDVPNFEIPAMWNTIGIVVPAGEDLQDMLTFAPGTMCELYFTQTAFNIGSKPTWKVVRQDVEDGGAS